MVDIFIGLIIYMGISALVFVSDPYSGPGFSIWWPIYLIKFLYRTFIDALRS